MPIISVVQSKAPLVRRPNNGLTNNPVQGKVHSFPITKGDPVSRNLTTAQASAKNAEAFRRKLAVLHQAAIGVILVRTREPFRAIDAMRDFTLAESNLNFQVWQITHGWEKWDRSRADAPTTKDNICDPLAALKALTGNGGQDTFGNGVFVMFYPHKPIGQSIAMVQIIKQYSRLFSEATKRLVLLVPPGWELPSELEDDVTVCDFELPTYAELHDSLDFTLNAVATQRRPNFSKADRDTILSVGAGMTAHEFENAASRALIEMRSTLPQLPVDRFCHHIMLAKMDVVKRSQLLEVMEVGSMNDIGGLDNLKRWIGLRAACFTEEAREFGVEPPKGIALIGPPGTGKSLCAKAIASVMAVPAIKFDVGRIFNSLVGESERRVREALKLVEAMAPCVLMMDEVDKAFSGQAGGGGGGDSGVGMRVLGSILTWMQECQKPVFMVVTANRVQNIPSEFLRRGRLDEIFSVTVPNATERRAILEIHLRKRKQDPSKIDLGPVVERCSGFVSAEIEAAVKDALVEAYGSKRPVNSELINDQFGQMVPLSEAFADDFNAMRTWAEQNACPASFPEGASIEAPRVRTRAAPTSGRRRSLIDANGE